MYVCIHIYIYNICKYIYISSWIVAYYHNITSLSFIIGSGLDWCWFTKLCILNLLQHLLGKPCRLEMWSLCCFHVKVAMGGTPTPRKINGWNLKITQLKRNIIFQSIILRFHVNLPGCSENLPRKMILSFGRVMD